MNQTEREETTRAVEQFLNESLDAKEAAAYVTDRLDGQFRQAEIASALGSGLILVSKKGKVTVKVRGRGKAQAAPARITPHVP